MSLTIGQQMALAVLRGDDVAAYALADKLMEERPQTFEQECEVDLQERRGTAKAHDGYAVYHWPEFRAFMERLGVRWNLDTTRLSIHLNEGEMVRIDHQYAGRDTSAPRYVPQQLGDIVNTAGAPYDPQPAEE